MAADGVLLWMGIVGIHAGRGRKCDAGVPNVVQCAFPLWRLAMPQCCPQLDKAFDEPRYVPFPLGFRGVIESQLGVTQHLGFMRLKSRNLSFDHLFDGLRHIAVKERGVAGNVDVFDTRALLRTCLRCTPRIVEDQISGAIHVMRAQTDGRRREPLFHLFLQAQTV